MTGNPQSDRVIGYVWPARSLRSEPLIEQQRERIRALCEGAAVLVDFQSDEGTPAPEIGAQFKRALAQLARGRVEGLVIAVSEGPVVWLHGDERFEEDLYQLGGRRLIQLGVADLWGKLAKARPTPPRRTGGFWQRLLKGPAAPAVERAGVALRPTGLDTPRAKPSPMPRTPASREVPTGPKETLEDPREPAKTPHKPTPSLSGAPNTARGLRAASEPRAHERPNRAASSKRSAPVARSLPDASPAARAFPKPHRQPPDRPSEAPMTDPKPSRQGSAPTDAKIDGGRTRPLTRSDPAPDAPEGARSELAAAATESRSEAPPNATRAAADGSWDPVEGTAEDPIIATGEWTAFTSRGAHRSWWDGTSETPARRASASPRPPAALSPSPTPTPTSEVSDASLRATGGTSDELAAPSASLRPPPASAAVAAGAGHPAPPTDTGPPAKPAGTDDNPADTAHGRATATGTGPAAKPAGTDDKPIIATGEWTAFTSGGAHHSWWEGGAQPAATIQSANPRPPSHDKSRSADGPGEPAAERPDAHPEHASALADAPADTAAPEPSPPDCGGGDIERLHSGGGGSERPNSRGGGSEEIVKAGRPPVAFETPVDTRAYGARRHGELADTRPYSPAQSPPVESRLSDRHAIEARPSAAAPRADTPPTASPARGAGASARRTPAEAAGDASASQAATRDTAKPTRPPVADRRSENWAAFEDAAPWWERPAQARPSGSPKTDIERTPPVPPRPEVDGTARSPSVLPPANAARPPTRHETGSPPTESESLGAARPVRPTERGLAATTADEEPAAIVSAQDNTAVREWFDVQSSADNGAPDAAEDIRPEAAAAMPDGRQAALDSIGPERRVDAEAPTEDSTARDETAPPRWLLGVLGVAFVAILIWLSQT